MLSDGLKFVGVAVLLFEKKRGACHLKGFRKCCSTTVRVVKKGYIETFLVMCISKYLETSQLLSKLSMSLHSSFVKT